MRGFASVEFGGKPRQFLMKGETHCKAGILFYLGFSLIFAEYLPKISILGVVVAAFAALLPDIDHAGSAINRRNPVLKAANKTMGVANKILKAAFPIGAAIAVVYFKSDVVKFLAGLGASPSVAEFSVYVLAFLLAVSGLLGGKLALRVPVVGDAMRISGHLLSMAGGVVSCIVYSAMGLLLCYVNYNLWNDPVVYIVAFLPLFASLSPHRSFTHSIEGFALFALAAWRVFANAGHADLTYPFAIGYASHLYLTDALTKEGVPLSFMPRVLRALPFHRWLAKNAAYSFAYRMLNARISLSLSRTGSAFESVYVVVLGAIVAVAWMVCGKI